MLFLRSTGSCRNSSHESSWKIFPHARTSCVKVKSDPDVDSRRSTLNAVVFTVNVSVAKFVCVVCTRKSRHYLHLVFGSHLGVSREGYTRFVSVWEISSGNVSVFGDLKVDNGWTSLKAYFNIIIWDH